MAVYVSRKKKVDELADIDLCLLFSRMVKARISIDFRFYKEMQDLDQFIQIWAEGDVLCSVEQNQLVFSPLLM